MSIFLSIFCESDSHVSVHLHNDNTCCVCCIFYQSCSQVFLLSSSSECRRTAHRKASKQSTTTSSRVRDLPFFWILPSFTHLPNSPSSSPRIHELYVQRYGRSIRIQGVGPVSSFFLFRFAEIVMILISVGPAPPDTRSIICCLCSQKFHYL
jgi:hypothetical protein